MFITLTKVIKSGVGARARFIAARLRIRPEGIESYSEVDEARLVHDVDPTKAAITMKSGATYCVSDSFDDIEESILEMESK